MREKGSFVNACQTIYNYYKIHGCKESKNYLTELLRNSP